MISVVILTKNEERNIERCLESVRWSDETIIIDDNSSDKTVEIASKYKVTIYENSLDGNFSAQRNFGLQKAKGEWVLFVDADEVISDGLIYEIQSAVGFNDQNLKNYNGFYLRRSDFIWGKQLKYGESGSLMFLRLGRRDKGIWHGKTHERWEIEGEAGKLINPILHFPHATLAEFLREINFYTDIRAKELNQKKVGVSFLSIILYPLGKFIVNFILKLGFMDGIQGLMFAITMSFHSFLVRSKLYLKNNE